MKKEIRRIIIDRNDVSRVYGFGSFFRGEEYNDIDILIVWNYGINDILESYYELEPALTNLGMIFGQEIHTLYFTSTEFESKPLRDWNQLIEIYPDLESQI